MGGRTEIDYQLEIIEIYREYRRNIEKYLRDIKETVSKYDPQAKLIIFGSYVKGCARVDSDIDILIVTKLAEDPLARAKLRIEIAKRIGKITPFEIHIATPKEYEEWYKKFIDTYIEM